MKVGSLVRQMVFKDSTHNGVFRYGILYKAGPEGLDLGFGWVFWQLNKDGPYVVANQSYCEAVQFKNIELVAEPN